MADDDVKANREEFQEARRAYVDLLVAQHPGTTHKTGDGVAIADLPEHFKQASDAAALAEREAAAKFLGVPVEEVDAAKAKLGTADATTPEQRTANLPAGQKPTLPTPVQQNNSSTPDAGGPKVGPDLLEEASREWLANFLK